MLTSEKDIYNVLKLARKYITSEARWCQGHMWDNEGRMCLMGAIWRATDTLAAQDAISYRVHYQAMGRVFEHTNGIHVPDFNDKHTHKEVLEVLDKAIGEVYDNIRANNTGVCAGTRSEAAEVL